MSAVYFLLLVLPLISAQVIGNGLCPEPHVQQDFNIHAYLGMWFEIAKIPSTIRKGICGTAEYKMGKGNSVTVDNTEFINGQFRTLTATIKVRQSGEKAKLGVQFSKSAPIRPYWVLSTDYNTYAVVYTCENHYDTHSQSAWIISRTSTLDAKTLHDAKRFLANQGIYSNKMEDTDQICYTKTHGRN